MAKNKNKDKNTASTTAASTSSTASTSNNRARWLRIAAGVIILIIIAVIITLLATSDGQSDGDEDNNEQNQSQSQDDNVGEEQDNNDSNEDEGEGEEQDNDSNTGADNEASKDIDGTKTTNNRQDAATQKAMDKAATTAARIADTGRWIATNYEPGDINTGEYEVKLGDTLWEIAEAAYGSGYEWTRILEQNKADIGFLPNGSQALIIPGQKLLLPEKK